MTGLSRNHAELTAARATAPLLLNDRPLWVSSRHFTSKTRCQASHGQNQSLREPQSPAEYLCESLKRILGRRHSESCNSLDMCPLTRPEILRSFDPRQTLACSLARPKPSPQTRSSYRWSKAVELTRVRLQIHFAGGLISLFPSIRFHSPIRLIVQTK